jgi:hypothetical protein
MVRIFWIASTTRSFGITIMIFASRGKTVKISTHIWDLVLIFWRLPWSVSPFRSDSGPYSHENWFFSLLYIFGITLDHESLHRDSAFAWTFSQKVTLLASEKSQWSSNPPGFWCPQKSPFSSVSICCPLLLCLLTDNRFVPGTNSWVKLSVIGKRGEVKIHIPVLSAYTKLITSLSTCPGLSEFHQIDFIKRSDIPHMPLNDN